METTKEIKEVVRWSAYGDYIAVDLVQDDKIQSTPFYITPKKPVTVWWGTPSSERPPNAKTFDDFHDEWKFEMIDGKLFVTWMNGPCIGGGKPQQLTADELPDWKFRHARKIS